MSKVKNQTLALAAAHAALTECVQTKAPDALRATPQQLEALQRFAERHGRTWKCRLVGAWMNGTDDRLPDGGLLRQVRNQLGVQWLRGFRLEAS